MSSTAINSLVGRSYGFTVDRIWIYGAIAVRGLDGRFRFKDVSIPGIMGVPMISDVPGALRELLAANDGTLEVEVSHAAAVNLLTGDELLITESTKIMEDTAAEAVRFIDVMFDDRVITLTASSRLNRSMPPQIAQDCPCSERSAA